MFHGEDEFHRSFRNARANLSALCQADHATILTNQGHPNAILVPLKPKNPYRPGPKDKGIAKAKRDFAAALELARTQ